MTSGFLRKWPPSSWLLKGPQSNFQSCSYVLKQSAPSPGTESSGASQAGWALCGRQSIPEEIKAYTLKELFHYWLWMTKKCITGHLKKINSMTRTKIKRKQVLWSKRKFGQMRNFKNISHVFRNSEDAVPIKNKGNKVTKMSLWALTTWILKLRTEWKNWKLREIFYNIWREYTEDSKG